LISYRATSFRSLSTSLRSATLGCSTSSCVMTVETMLQQEHQSPGLSYRVPAGVTEHSLLWRCLRQGLMQHFT
jgi:hypothetical protein